ncbi:DivIVA domain-containing protein [Timonella senegalensis]|uniref:DivIVA domain-containing protein n=1 Tax=Timonella senegalensis TaxID=1465825 RepID=UPI00058BB7C8|nr:DivIVA domain-containing protein [Timonella senegalensis]
MELLTPDEVLNKKFQVTKFREGYDMIEVDDFLDLVLGTLRAVYLENDELKSKLSEAEERVAELSRSGAAEAAEVAPAAVEEPVEFAAQPEPESEVAHVAEAGAPAAREPEMATGIIQMAQKLHDDHVRAGQEEGERLVSEAKTEGDRIVREAEEISQRTLNQLEQERSVLETKIDELRTFERDYRLRLKSYLQNLLGDLDQRGAGLGGADNSGI